MSEIIVEQIIKGVADANNVKPKDLSFTLQDHIETDVIRMLTKHQSNSWRLQFETPKHIVEVTGNETVFVNGRKM